MKFAFHGRVIDTTAQPYIEDLVNVLKSHGTDIYVTEVFHSSNPFFQEKHQLKVLGQAALAKETDIFISLGGDGTFLETVTYVGVVEKPILGINTGRLGFLASVSKEQIKEAVSMILSGEYSIDKRTMVSLDADIPLFDGKTFALNEFSILRKETSSMIAIKAFLNGHYLNSYWADGLMVATPTGSTGYSLSCGGPIILPQTSNFIITPVSPHNLNIRPLIVPDDSELAFEVESRNTAFLVALDSRSVTVESSVKLRVRKAQFHAHIVRLKGTSFVETLRNKLSWGLDKRN